MSDRDYLRADSGSPGSPFWAVVPATKAMVFGLVGVHLLMAILRAVDPEAYLGVLRFLLLDPELVLQRGYVWQMITGALLHAPGFWHLVGNCFTIWFFGRLLEQRLGVRRYLLFCAASSVTASFAYLFWAVLLSNVTPMLGASGVGMGIIALAALWYPRMTVILFVFPMQLWVLAVFFVASDLLGILSVDSNIAHTAHLGGALYGLLYWRYQRRIEGLFDSIDRFAERRKRKKARRERMREEEMREEVDRILDKVNREGMPALTDEERRFLKNASSKLRP